MKRHIWKRTLAPALALLVLALLVLALLPLSANAEERIKEFVVTASMEKDSTMLVRERIKVNIEHDAIKRGIYRVFRTTQRLDSGKYRHHKVSIVSVTLDGKKVPYTTASRGNHKAVVIGDEKTMAPLGEHEYVIIYKTTNHVRFFDDRDEIYLNVTGNEWKLPIDKTIFSLRVPGGGDNITKTAAFTGKFGERGSDAVIKQGKNKDFIFYTTRRLQPGEGLTVAAAWTKGLVDQPEPTFTQRMNQYRELSYLGVFGCLVLFFFLCRLWLGSTPRQTIIPLFYAPVGMSPGYMAALKDRAYTGRVLHGDILWAAVNGYLRMDMTDKKNMVMRTRKPAKKPDLWVQYLCEPFAQLLCGSMGCNLKTANGREKARSAFESQVRTYHEKQKELWKDTLLYKVFCWFSMSTLIFFVTLFTDSPAYTEGVYTEMEFLGSTGIGFVIIAISYFAATKTWREHEGFTRIWKMGLALVVLLPLGVLLLWVVAEEDFALVAMLGGLAMATTVLMKRLPGGKYTKEGLAKYAQMKGLEMYICTAEKHRLAKINAPDDTVQKYEELLPYAVALGHAAAWQKRFDSLLHEMDYSPEWIETPTLDRGETLDYRTVVRTVTTSAAMSAAVAACAATSQAAAIASKAHFDSSGSSGYSSGSGFSSSDSDGGSSGGGSGGGGGGGW